MKLTIISSAVWAIASIGVAQASPVYKLLKPVTTLAVEGQSSSNPVPASTTKLAFNESTSSHEVLLNSTVQKSLTLTNEGPDTVAALKLTTNKGSITNTTCSTSLAKNDSCVATVQYPVNDMTATTVELTATGTAANKPVSVVSTMNIQPLAAMQDVQVSSPSVLLKSTVGTKATASFNVVNPNPYEISLSTPTFLSGAVEPSTTCGTTLAAGASCTITVSATPVSTTTVNGAIQFSASKQGVEFPHSVVGSIQSVDPYTGFSVVKLDFEGISNLNAIPPSEANVSFAPVGTPTIGVEPNGNRYLKLDGKSALYSVNKLPAISGDTTISFDIKFDEVGPPGDGFSPMSQYVISYYGADNFYLLKQNASTYSWVAARSAGHTISTHSKKPVVGQWYHVEFTRKGGTLILTVDGKRDYNSYELESIITQGTLVIGALSTSTYGLNYGVRGGIDNIVIASKVL